MRPMRGVLAGAMALCCLWPTGAPATAPPLSTAFDLTNTPAPPPPPGPPASSAAPPPAAAPPVGPVDCQDQDLVLAARVDQTTYRPGQHPTFTWLIDNIGPSACRRDLDPGLRELVVADAGGAKVWSDRDCSRPHLPAVVTLSPGTPLVSRLTWTGHFSAPGCAASGVPIGPGSYRLTARLGSLTSGPTSFTIGQ